MKIWRKNSGNDLRKVPELYKFMQTGQQVMNLFLDFSCTHDNRVILKFSVAQSPGKTFDGSFQVEWNTTAVCRMNK